ncbi:DUF6314 family protein [Citreimonas salinaria]|uniref:DUF6314 domain-containing protein n=1 Tax=Citreimonas salinaria TaxID=321339 RepID=A0A1H3G234_9RHOB|nr:DUF6314 family protein [Citreimonas salinaria]SDX97392.1 hypothetical protein SAMN05444340_102115 [Citreimonas salinaria]
MSDTGQGRRLADFIGSWRLERQIRHGDGSVARFDGRAEWRAEGGGALCLETGTLTLPDGVAVQAERRYLWDEALQVRFQDGRFFHAVPPLGGRVAHDCPPDRYEATYDFAEWPRWRCTWRVRGPRKDYAMHGLYAPEG